MLFKFVWGNSLTHDVNDRVTYTAIIYLFVALVFTNKVVESPDTPLVMIWFSE